MANYKPLVKSVEGLQTKYNRSFQKYVESALAIEDPLAIIFDEIDNQNRSKLFIYLRGSWDEFQSPFAVAAGALGEAIYTSNRDAAELKRKNGFPSFEPPSLTAALLQDNLMNYWTVAGMLSRVIAGEQTAAFVGQSGAKALLDLVRAATDANAVADKKTKKRAKIALSGGACAFCRDNANAINGTEPGAAYDKVKFHNDCTCTLVYEYL